MSSCKMTGTGTLHCIFLMFLYLYFFLCSTAEQDSMAPSESSGPASGAATAPTTAQQQRVPIHKPFTQSRLPPDLPMHPAPRHITEEELRVLEGCLHRWRSEVENDTRGESTRLPFSAPFICITAVVHFLCDIVKVKN